IARSRSVAVPRMWPSWNSSWWPAAEAMLVRRSASLSAPPTIPMRMVVLPFFGYGNTIDIVSGLMDGATEMPVLTLPDADARSLTVRAKALVFADPRSGELLRRIEQIAPSSAPVLVMGETD